MAVDYCHFATVAKGAGRLFVNWLPDMDILQLHSSDPDLTKPWDGKISSEDIAEDGKTIHLIRC